MFHTVYGEVHGGLECGFETVHRADTTRAGAARVRGWDVMLGCCWEGLEQSRGIMAET